MSIIHAPNAIPAPWRQELTPEQRALAKELTLRANRLRDGVAAGGDSLSIREALNLAAVQMGVAL
jgi:hypothetical protein